MFTDYTLNINTMDVLFYNTENIKPEYVKLCFPYGRAARNNELSEEKWSILSKNPSPIAMQVLLENQHKINWDYLSANPSLWAIQLLYKNPNKINWRLLSYNSSPWHGQFICYAKI